ncbi:hypothetical protein BJX63DRAFT_429879 [Aspergillus granulosus]|uniref:Uncharacterized protein n=1 Tax=Aspergillus granulosus TaxID=176169 RepID=A0ABR4HNV4_9EURO
MNYGTQTIPVPDWGQLPVEQYLIRYWNHSSSESVDEQRQRLVHQYMQLEQIPKEWDPTCFGMELSKKPERTPTAEEIALILRPWRSDDLRTRAWEIWCGRDSGPPVMLRTYYSNSNAEKERDDVKFIEYTTISENFEDVASWTALNDATLFNFGSDWRQIFSILPEVAGCRETYTRGPYQETLDLYLPNVKGSIEDAKAANPQWETNVDLLLEEGKNPIRSILSAASLSWLFIVDEHTFETDELLVVYIDMNQDVTIQGRLEVDQGDIDYMMLSREFGSPRGMVIDEGTVRDKYLLSNDFGRKFFGLESDTSPFQVIFPVQARQSHRTRA